MTTNPTYPNFRGDSAAEIIWLQGQVTRLQGDVLFYQERLRLRAFLWEAKQELNQLHYRESMRQQARVLELERALGEVGAEKAGHPTFERGKMALSVRNMESRQSVGEGNSLPPIKTESAPVEVVPGLPIAQNQAEWPVEQFTGGKFRAIREGL